MKVGWMWFDDSNRTLEEKVIGAVRQYRDKFGRLASVCAVHPSVLGCDEKQWGRLKVVADRYVLQHHFWVGENE